MVGKLAFCVALLLGCASAGHAACRDEVNELKPRIDALKKVNPPRYYLALKWWGSAQEAQSGSETECLNLLARARKALVEPLPLLADCKGPNAYLPACQNGVLNADIGPAGPVQPIGGGGLGNAAGAGPTPPGGRPVPFNPPGSATGPGQVQATGTGRTD